MAKKIGIKFEDIKGMVDYGEDVPKSAEDNKIGKDLISKIQDAGHEVVVYAESDRTMERDSDEPDFQKALIKSIVKNKLEEKKIPYDSITYNDSGLDINLNYEITRYEDWEGTLIDILKSTK